MKFIKQSSIDNLIDEARIDVVIGATEELKERCSLFLLLLYGRKRNSFMCACCKELFYDNSAFWWELRAVHHEKYPTMNFFEAVEK
jgi:hypothetical protein